MRVGQDLCIALVLAVVGAACGPSAEAPPETEASLAFMEDAMAGRGFSAEEKQSVRALIAQAQERQRAGDEDGAAHAMSQASGILNIA